MSNRDWFEKVKSYDLPLFLEQAYHIDVSRAKKCLCPFHDDTKPTMSLTEKESGWIFKCFACDTSGDITKFVTIKDGVSPLDAVRKILIFHGEDIEAGGKKELSPKEQAEIEQRTAEVAQRKEAKAKEEAKLKADALVQMTKASSVYAQNLYTAYEQGNEAIIKTVEAKFPHIYNNTEIRDVYMGWDYDNDALCLINRNIRGETFNIKSERRKGFFKEWKFGAAFQAYAFPGKWISWKNATTRVFGVEFWDKEDNRVVVCEGEKDAINLLLLGINAVTLGGVTNGWEEHKAVLKDKYVYLFFDNDKAGYINAIKRHKEIENVTKNTQVVLFFKIGSFGQKYDVSDYLVEKSIKDKETFFGAITYSCFTPTNMMIEEITDYLDKQLSDGERETLASFKSEEVIKKFQECKADIIKATQPAKGERDAQINYFLALNSYLEHSTSKEKIKKIADSLFEEDTQHLMQEMEKFRDLIGVKTAIINEFRQVHIHDIVNELKRAAKSVGHDFMTYREMLYFWTGTHFYKIEAWEYTKFVLNEFLPAAKVEYKKQTSDTNIKVIQNLHDRSEAMESWIDPKKRVINMRNGALIVRDTGAYVFRDHHRKQDCAMNMLEFAYDEKADAPKWKAFLNRVLPEADDQNALMEFMGYCFLPSHRFEKFLFLYGASGANGKSVVLEVIRDFFSRENVSSLELHNFEGHELFALRNKIINIGAEINSGGDMKKQLSALKNITSTSDALNINPKNKDPFDIYPEEKPKMAFAGNKQIMSDADDGGVLRRMLMLHFNQEIKDDEKIRDLTERFKDEKPGILNLAIKGLERLIRQGAFSMSESRMSFMEEYKTSISPVRAYIQDCLIAEKGVMVAKDFVHAHFSAWCEENGMRSYDSRYFWKKFKELHSNIDYNYKPRYEHELLGKRPMFLRDFRFNVDSVSEFEFKKQTLEVKNQNISQTGLCPVSWER